MTSPGAIAFQVGPVVIRWYGILMATSIVVGLWLGHREARKEGLPADDFISAGQWAILAGLVGARLYEVIFNWDYYGRFLIESVRLDSFWIGPFRVAQIASVVGVGIAIAGLAWTHRRAAHGVTAEPSPSVR